jgi:hypothetical protein
LSENEVSSALADVIARFEGRHHDLVGIFRRHVAELADRLNPDVGISDERMVLLGAVFTSEYAIEGAALCNPSMVVHPDQAGVAAGSVRFVMSVRGIGEGHRSSIGFRTGVIDSAGRLSVDQCASVATVGTTVPGLLDAAVFRVELARLDDAGEADVGAANEFDYGGRGIDLRHATDDSAAEHDGRAGGEAEVFPFAQDDALPPTGKIAPGDAGVLEPVAPASETTSINKLAAA